jgi:intracellular septation protein
MAGRKINPWLKIGLDLGPVVAFFIAFVRFKGTTFSVGGTEYGGFILATAIFIPLMIVSTLILWRLTGRLSVMQIVTLILVIVFGGLSVWFNDERFFKMKPTMIYLLFAGILGWGYLRGKSYLALAIDDAVPLQHEGWMLLTKRLALFFLGLAIANEVIWRTMSDQAWVNFKTFGLPGAIFVFFMAQSGIFSKYAVDEKG